MGAYFEYRNPISIDRIDYGKNANRATVRLHGRFFDRQGEIQEEHLGRDSALAAVKRAIEDQFGFIEILSHQSRSEGAGINANSRSRIVITAPNGKQYEGEGVDQDIEVSAMRALIDATNRAYIDKHFSKKRNVNDGSNQSSIVAKAYTTQVYRAS